MLLALQTRKSRLSSLRLTKVQEPFGPIRAQSFCCEAPLRPTALTSDAALKSSKQGIGQQYEGCHERNRGYLAAFSSYTFLAATTSRCSWEWSTRVCKLMSQD